MKKLILLTSLLTLTACGATDAGNSFMEVYETYKNHPITEDKWPQNPTEVGGLVIDRCPPKPKEKCTSLLSIMQTGENEFYIKEKRLEPGEYYGPFKGDPLKIAEEAKKIDTIKE